MQRAFKSMHRGPWSLDPETRIAACQYSAAGIEHVFAQHDILAGNVRLIGASAIVATDNAAVGCRPLGPVNPAIFEGQLFRGVIARWQAGDERLDLPGYRVHGYDARAVVLSRRVSRLVRIGSEKA